VGAGVGVLRANGIVGDGVSCAGAFGVGSRVGARVVVGRAVRVDGAEEGLQAVTVSSRTVIDAKSTTATDKM